MPDPTTLPSPFPNLPRIIYRKNPLNEVLCQLRFPPILRIAAETPATFQERIRKEYPLFRERQPEVALPPGIPNAVAELMKGLPKQKPSAYEFVSEDGLWKTALTRESLALTSARYIRWEEFRKRLDTPLKALLEVYSPAFFSRVGLRYQNVIRRSVLGLPETTTWAQLIKPHVTGILAANDVLNVVEEMQSQTVIKLAIGKVTVRSAIAEVTDQKKKEDCFLIDNDFFTNERTKLNDVDGILRYFNRQSGNLFRWSIEDRLHTAMQPDDLGAAA